MLINFSKITPEDFEFLIEDILIKKGFNIDSRPSRGSDRGKDILASRRRIDDMGLEHFEEYLVECKNNARSNKSVSESDIGNFQSKLTLHKRNRYLLATSTLLTENLKDQLIASSKDSSYPFMTVFWTKTDLISFLYEFPDLAKKYFGVVLSSKITWDYAASQIANFMKKHHFEAHRGAVSYAPDVTAIFGNDGYSAKKTEAEKNVFDASEEVNILKEKLRFLKIKILGFGLCEEKYSWVLIIKNTSEKDTRFFNDLIWECSEKETSTNNSAQKAEAHKRIWSYLDRPFYQNLNHVQSENK